METGAKKFPFSVERTLHELFEAQVEKWPDQAVVFFQGRSMTYAELNGRANQLARTLRKAGVRPDTLVGLMVERSLEMVVGVLAILKAGGAYLPIDPTLVQERVEYMLSDSQTHLLLTTRNILQSKTLSTKTLLIDDPKQYAEDRSNLLPLQSSHHLAYVIYTSGSTGEPKGVMIEQRSVVNLVRFFIDYVQVRSQDKIVQFTSLSFDGSVGDLFMSLLTGAELHIPSKEQIDDFQQFVDFMNHNRITISAMPPDYLKNIEPEQLPFLRLVLAAGSEMTNSLLDKWNARVELLNCYGPTEATVCTTVWAPHRHAMPADVIPIGRPIANAQVYVLDSAASPLPTGEVGEICIGGLGLARGYWRREELTAKKFIEHPLQPGAKLYRTGDLGRFLPGGLLQFVGRADDLVKVRGFRIELGEVQANLQALPEVNDAVVLAETSGGETTLFACVVVADESVSIQHLKEELAKKLPAYMIPAEIVPVKQIPLSANGKVDRTALRKLRAQQAAGHVMKAARNARESMLQQVFREVLQKEAVGVDENFFELGGHSLKAAALVGRLRKELAVELPLRALFEAPTIEELSLVLEQATARVQTVAPAMQRDFYAITYAQKSMLLHAMQHPEDLTYNIPGLLLIEGPLEFSRWNRAFQALVERHEALRTSFAIHAGRPVQRIHADVPFAIKYSEQPNKSPEQLLQAFLRPFDLSQPPLFRAELVRMAEERHLFLTDMHHILGDGLSTAIFLKEFMALYKGETLAPLRLQYKDFAEWQQQQLAAGAWAEQEAFWGHLLAGASSDLRMETDFPRPIKRSFAGDVVTFPLRADATEQIRQKITPYGATFSMFLLAVYAVFLFKRTQQEDLIIGSPIANRTFADSEGMFGHFFNVVPMRILLNGAKTFLDLLHEIRTTWLSVFEHRDYPFERLLEKRIAAPLSTMFIMQNTEIPDLELETLRIAQLPVHTRTTKLDFHLEAFDRAGQLELRFEYSTALFRRETVCQWSAQLHNILEQVLVDPKLCLNEIEIVSSDQQEQWLSDFNDDLDEAGV